MKGTTIFLFLLSLELASQAQSRRECQQLPAPCPDEGSISQTQDVAARTRNNDVFLQELKMEDQVRSLLSEEVERVAKTKGWTVYELNEEGLGGRPYVDIRFEDWEATPFNKRPPHYYQISFIFIINQDSLQAWKDWAMAGVEKQQQAIEQYGQSQKSNAVLTKYQDSMAYFTGQLSNLLQNEFPAYQKDLQSKNQKGIETYEHKQKKLQDGMDRVQKKVEAIQSGADQGFDDLNNNEINPGTVAFAESSMALIHFYINPYEADFALDNGARPQRTLKIPGAFYAGMTTNGVPADRHNYEIQFRGFYFNNPSSVATILFGDYLPGQAAGEYRSAFAKNFTTGKSTISGVKNVTCDRVQTALAHVEGKAATVDAILKTIDWSKLSSLLYTP